MPKKPSKKIDESNWSSQKVSLRISKKTMSRVASAADKLGVSRNRLIGLVLREYVVERGEDDLAKIVEKDSEDANHLNIFE